MITQLAPNDRYQKFFNKFKEIDTLPIADWKYQHLLGYFCRKYKEAYGTDYQWKFNHQSPSKCYEVWQYNVLCSKLSSNPSILRDYIDWAFLNIVSKAKKKLTSISFMTKDEVVNDYKLNVLLASQQNTTINRATPIPPNYQEAWKMGSSMNIQTYGDLAFIAQMKPLPDDVRLGLQKMEEIGFDQAVLERVI